MPVNCRNIVFAAGFAVLFSLASSAHAHGPQLQITNDGGQIVTRRIYVEAPYEALAPEKSVYVMPLLEFNGAWYSRPNTLIDPALGLPVYYSGPGLAWGQDQADGGPRAFEEGTNFVLNFTDGLKRWDGAAFVDPGTEQIQAFRGGNADMPSATAVTTDTGPFEGLAFGAIAADYDAEAHSSSRFRLLGDGSDGISPSQDGVYLVSLSVASTQAGLAPSDPFYFVMHKNTTPDVVSAAVASLGIDASLVQVVPEPASVALVVIAAAGLAVCGWRGRHAKELAR
jgi:hypothetical protein